MTKQEQEEQWEELKYVWKNSSKTQIIKFKMSKLVTELESKVSTFEKESIKRDLIRIETSWDKFKGKISTFEKESIKRDLILISKWAKKFLNLFRNKKE